MARKPQLGILSIATNQYLDFWTELASSIDKTQNQPCDIRLHVFTNRVSEAVAFSKQLKSVRVSVHEIPAYGWPEATLFRFKVFAQALDEIDEPYLMYLDADSVMTGPLEERIFGMMDSADVLLVEQSGSWRPKQWSKFVRFYILHPGAIYADLGKLLFEGGLGTWEKRRESLAYVPRKKRKHYVYGAVWMGTRRGIRKLSFELANRVQRDWDRGIIARWHDESHLNWWCAQYSPPLLDPRYYFFPGQHHLDELPSIITMVPKAKRV